MGDLIFGGTGTIGHLFEYDPATGTSTDLGEAVAGQTRVASLVVGPDGLVYGGSGSNDTDGHLFSFSASDPWVRTDIGIPVPTSLEIGSLTLLGGLVYGATGDQYTLFSYDPALQKLWVVGQVQGIYGITCMTAGPDGNLYGGDYPGGQLWVFDPSTGLGATLGSPVSGETSINAVVAGPDGNIYGGTGSIRGQFFRYGIAGGAFEVLGSPVWRDTRIYSLVLGSDSRIYGGTGARRGRVFRYDPLNAQYAPGGTATSISIAPRMRDKTYVPGTSEVWALALDDEGIVYGSGYAAAGYAKFGRWDPAVGGPMEIVGMVPGWAYAVFDLLRGPDGLIYGGGGTYDGPNLFSYDPISNTLAEVPMGMQMENAVYTLALCPDGLIYGGTGGYSGDSGQLFSFDPLTSAFLYYGQAVPGETSIDSLACAPDGTLYGGTYPSAHLFSFGDLGFEDLGQPIPGEADLSAVTWGADGKVYGGTVGSGRFFAYDPTSREVSDLGRPFPEDSEIWNLAASPDGLLFGVTGGTEGHLFAYDPALGQLSDLGRAYFYERYVYGLAIDATGRTIYLGTGWTYGEMVAYERDYRFGWLGLQYGLDTPEGTGLAVDVLDTEGNVLLADVPSGSSLLSVSSAETPAIQLRAILSTSDPAASPALLDWQVDWTEDPVMAIAPTGLEFVASAGGPDPRPQILSVTNTSGGELTWSLSGLPAWLEADPVSGMAPSDVTATARAGQLPVGVYTATLQFEGGVDCVNCPVPVPVKLTVLHGPWRIYLPLIQR